MPGFHDEKKEKNNSTTNKETVKLPTLTLTKNQSEIVTSVYKNENKKLINTVLDDDDIKTL